MAGFIEHSLIVYIYNQYGLYRCRIQDKAWNDSVSPGTVAQADKGLSLLAEAWTITDQNGQRYIDSERHRLEGELLLHQTDDH